MELKIELHRLQDADISNPDMVFYDLFGMADDGTAPISNCKVMKVRFSREGQMTFRKIDRRKKFETGN